MLLTDALGSVLAAFSNTQGSAALLGNQAYGPFGNRVYNSGAMNTAKGYTGQYADPLTGLDYYRARYYDPAVGVFLSADVKQGNAQGINPYAYTGENPETYNDPTGQMYAPPTCCGEPPPPPQPQPHPGPACPDPAGCNGSGNSGSNSTQTKNKVKLGGCDAQCENDKLLVQQYIQNERAKEEALNSAVGDILSLAADIFAAAADFAADAYLAFVIDVITIAGHFVALLANLSTMGLISIPRWLVTVGDAFQSFAPILSGIKSFVQYLGLGPVAGLASNFVKWMTTSARGSLMSAVSGLIGGVFGGENVYLDATKYDSALDAVNGYNAQTAYNICLQDYSSDPGRC